MKKKIYQQPQTAVVNVSFEGLLSLGTQDMKSVTVTGSVQSGLNNLADDEDDNLNAYTDNSGITNNSVVITTKKHNLWDVDW